MKKYFYLALLVLLSSVGTLQAQIITPATDLPNISVIGNFLGTYSQSEKTFNVKEIEFAFQHYLYPSVKVDIFTALHKEASGERNFELEEAYVTFFDMVGVMLPDSNLNIGLGGLLGKKLLNIGKINPLHPEQWEYLDRPLAIHQFFGGEEGLSAEGGQLSYLLPLPFFSQMEAGYWTANNHEEDIGDEEESMHGIEYTNRLFTGRLWSSFSVDDTKELELGLSYLIGNNSAQSEEDKPEVYGLDLTYTQNIDSNRMLRVASEFYQAKYGHEGDSRANQSGGFLSSFLELNNYYNAGIRYGYLSKHGGEGDLQNQYSFIVSRQLTDTSKFRVQYNTGDSVETTLLAQFIFGMGPHAHVLQ
jgi:hypothetical protein